MWLPFTPALLRVSLAIFKLKAPELMAMNEMTDIFSALRSPCTHGSVDDMSGCAGTGTFTADDVIKTAWGTTTWLGAFPGEKIAAFRAQHVQEHREVEKAKNVQLASHSQAQPPMRQTLGAGEYSMVGLVKTKSFSDAALLLSSSHARRRRSLSRRFVDDSQESWQHQEMVPRLL